MVGTAKLRTWFLRNLLEAAERELGAQPVAALPARVPDRLRAHLSLERLRASGALDAIPLDEGEEALVAFDQMLGDGTGRVFERVACEMLARQLVQATAAVRVGDLFGTVARLRGPFEHPFVDTPLTFELQKTPSGLTLTVGVAGRPRATRLLGQLASAAITAAERFAREAHAEPLKLKTETIADRSRVEARFRRASSAPPPPQLDPVPVSKRISPVSRASTSLSAEVARILAPSFRRERAPDFSDEPPSRRHSSGDMDAVTPEPPARISSAPPARTSSAPPPKRESVPPPKRESVPPPSGPFGAEPPTRKGT